MSPLDVHVNRAPVGGEVLAVTHTPGEFRAAYRDVASQHNERNLVVIRDAADRRHAFVQVAGYLARRIVCRVHPQDHVFAGARIGLIMFGSRCDHFLPMDYRLTVAIGDRVRAGETVIGELKR
jgi:phosphatidylserine decarboxylase